MRSPCNVTATLLCLRPELVGINGVWPAEGTNTAAQHVQVPSTEQSTIGGIFIRCIVAIFKTNVDTQVGTETYRHEVLCRVC